MKNRSTLLALALFLLALSPLAAASMIQRGIDVFTTPADGRTYYDFAQNPIPAGFFCEGSKAFTGRVALKGLPLATAVDGALANSDTVIERLDDAVFDAKGKALTRIQLRVLSLASIAPIRTGCGAYHVYVSLGGEQRVTAMNIYRTEEGGGRFVAPLAVNARMSFIPVKPVRNKVARRLELAGSFTFPASPLPWSYSNIPSEKRIRPAVVDTNGDLTPDTLLPGTTSFAPGQTPSRQSQNKLNFEQQQCPCWEITCHTDSASGKEHCTGPYLPPGCESRLCGGGGIEY